MSGQTDGTADRHAARAARRAEIRARTVERHVAARLRRERERLGLSVQDLARRVGLPEADVMKYESLRRKLSAGLLLLFAEALNCTPDYFFRDFEDAEEQSRPGR